MVGCAVEELDRRQRIRSFLRSGTLPPDKPVAVDYRHNKEVLIPLQDAGQLLGVISLVTPPAETNKHGRPGSAQRTQSNGNSDATWRARYSFADLIGNSPALVHARDLALRAAQMGSSVLITGESGTGKELFAHAIHAASPRRAYPFVPVDCSAIPRELLEAELFGYAPGAFTGANREGKLGKFELAHGGTVFLDEIGEMPLEMQAKLLRVLQERQLIRVGGVTPVPVAFTVIAATNRDLESLAAEGRFRRDLLYRLDVVRIEVPPLAERPEDIPVLVEHYWARKSQELGHAPKLSTKAMRVMQGYSWPGNVRELHNLVERLLVGVTKPVIEPADLPLYLRQEVVGRVSRSPSFHLPTVAAEAERRTLERVLRLAQGNRTNAIQLVGMSRSSFYRKLKMYGFVNRTRRSRMKG